MPHNNPLEALKKASSIGADPRFTQDPNKDPRNPNNWLRGEMPLDPVSLGNLTRVAGRLGGVIKPYLPSLSRGAGAAVEEAPRAFQDVSRVVPDLVQPGPGTAQVAPAAADVEALEGLLKFNLAKTPSAAPARQFYSPAETASLTGPAADILNPETAAQMSQMFEQANPTFRAMERSGAFAGDRSRAGLVSAVGRAPSVADPSFVPVGDEAVYNALRPVASHPSPPGAMEAFKKYTSKR